MDDNQLGVLLDEPNTNSEKEEPPSSVQGRPRRPGRRPKPPPPKRRPPEPEKVAPDAKLLVLRALQRAKGELRGFSEVRQQSGVVNLKAVSVALFQLKQEGLAEKVGTEWRFIGHEVKLPNTTAKVFEPKVTEVMRPPPEGVPLVDVDAITEKVRKEAAARPNAEAWKRLWEWMDQVDHVVDDMNILSKLYQEKKLTQATMLGGMMGAREELEERLAELRMRLRAAEGR